MNRKNIKQQGAALLMAMLTVALVATFAAAALWQQWRSVEVETAERARVQSEWILTGALDWARLLLREDRMGAGSAMVDHLGEPWAVPLQEARLSSFLAAEKNNTTTDLGPEMLDAFLSGQIIDLQSMMSVDALVSPAGQPNKERIEAFGRLFALLNLPESELDKLVENLRLSIVAGRTGPSPSEAPLQPQRLSELVWLGLSPQTITALEPYVTILPRHDVRLNVNTASAEVIAAARDIDLSDAQRMVQMRNAGNYFRNVEDFQARLGAGNAAQGQGYELSVSSDFFEVRARLRLDKLVVEERSVLERAGNKVTVLSRERGPAPASTSSTATTGQR